MKSKIFSSKEHTGIFGESLWIPVLTGLILAVVHTIGLLSEFGQWETIYVQESIEKLCLGFWKNMMAGKFLWVVMGIGTLCAWNSFLYLHIPRQVDFVHSLPVKRERLFGKKVLESWMSFILPYAAVLLLSMGICTLKGTMLLSVVGYAFQALLLHSVVFFWAYGVAALALILTGRPLMGALGNFTLLAYGYVAVEILVKYMEVFFRTFRGVYQSSLLLTAKSFSSPFMAGQKAIEDWEQGEYASLVIYAACAAGLMYLCMILYKKRSSESAGRSMAFPAIAVLIKFFVQILLILGFGISFYNSAGTAAKGWLIFGLVFGSLVSHGVMEILYSMNLREFCRHKRQFFFITACAALLVACFWFDWLGYDTYFPKKEKVQSMGICVWDLDNQSITEWNRKDLQGEYSRFFSAQPMQREWIYLENYDSFYSVLERVAPKKRNWEEIWQEEGIHGLSVVYCLTSGREIQRTYPVRDSEMQEIAAGILDQEEYKKSRYGSMEEKREILTEIHGIFWGMEKVLYANDEEKQKAFFDALCRDIEEADASVYEEYPLGKVYLGYTDMVEHSLILKKGDNRSEYSFQDYLYIFPGYTRTVALLMEEEVQIYPEPEMIKEINITVYQDSADAKFSYTAPEEIKKLAPALIDQSCYCSWLGEVKMKTVVSVICISSSGEEAQTTAGLVLDLCPEEFLKQWEEAGGQS